MGQRLVALVRAMLALALTTCGSDKDCSQYDREAQQMEQNLMDSYRRDYPGRGLGPCNPPPSQPYYDACQQLAAKQQQARDCRSQ